MQQGIFSLTQNDGASDLAITAAGTIIGEVIDDLDGMTALTFEADFYYGSGGATVKHYLQTSLNQGTTWVDIACIAFGTAAEHKLLNLSGLTPKTTQVDPTDGALTDDTAIDGILGDRLRTKTVVAGTYAGSTVLASRAAVR